MEPKPTILIVDDEPANLALIRAFLRTLDCSVRCAEDGVAALQLLEGEEPDLVLLDIELPGVGGLEVCRRIRSHPRLSALPVILMTGLDGRDIRTMGLEAGADDFLPKPLDLLELKLRVRSVLQLNRYRRLVRERAKFEHIANHSSDGWLQLDAANKILYANRQARLYLGLDPIAGKDLAVPDFLELVRSRFVVEEGGDKARLPLQLMRPETAHDQALWLKVEPYSPGDNDREGALVRLTNVSDEVGVKRDMWQFQSLLSHKLRTPLVGLLGSLDALIEDFDSFSPEEVREFLTMSRDSARRLNQGLNSVLDFKNVLRRRPEEGEFCLIGLPLLAGCIGEPMGLGGLSIELDEDVQFARVGLSASTLETILNELLENTCKFHPEHRPTVMIRGKRCAPDSVKLEIIDNGVSVPPDRMEKIWQPYYQSEKYFTGEVAGMGLGLPKIAEIIAGCGGSCRLYNRAESSGVTVEMQLPLI